MLSKAVPNIVAKRVLWIFPVMLWGMAMAASLISHLHDIETQSLNVATEGARNMFRMVVLTRAWNAEHGGIYLAVSDQIKPNPYLEHPRRDLVTTDGTRLTMVNPAYMTRLISELAARQQGATFRITSLKPIRPGNEPDTWERRALTDFETGLPEAIEVVQSAAGNGKQLRYMAPLHVTPSCLSCHARQGYRNGDIRGGISVSVPFAAVERALGEAKRQSLINHLAIFLLGSLVGLAMLELLRRRWLKLGETIGQLEAAQAGLATSNQQLRAAKEMAEAGSQAKSRFLANMSHELRTPLNAITGFTHLLKRKVSDPKQQENLEQILHASDHLLEMIDQLLSLSKSDFGPQQVALESFQVGRLAEELFSELLGKLAGRPLAAALEIEPSVMACWLRGDRRHIGEIVRHFLANAAKFSEAGEITLSVGLTDVADGQSRLRLAVRDQGIGIAAEHLPELFSLFHQIDGSATRSHGGSGIGLILCKRLADMMGGEVGCESVLGQGSCFWLEVTLPTGSPASDGELAGSASLGSDHAAVD